MGAGAFLKQKRLSNGKIDFRSVLVSIATHPFYAQKDVTM